MPRQTPSSIQSLPGKAAETIWRLSQKGSRSKIQINIAGRSIPLLSTIAVVVNPIARHIGLGRFEMVLLGQL